MQLTIFNGSPRNKKSNSKILTEHFLQGFNEASDSQTEVFYLASLRNREMHLKAFSEAETCLFVFPLYTDAMPGIVKDFFEMIYLSDVQRPARLGFIVQSGFAESIHSVYLERYLEKFTRRLKCEYIGTVIKGGVEGIQIMPPSMTRRLFKNFKALGKHFAETGQFSEEIKKEFAKPYKMPILKQWLYPLLPSSLLNFYWNSNLKKNKAWENRFDAPYKF
jgi:NAD(P)H-dependent FMN reductase